MLPESPGGSGENGEEVLGARAPSAAAHTPSLSCSLRVLSVEKRTDRVSGKESRPGVDFAARKAGNHSPYYGVTKAHTMTTKADWLIPYHHLPQPPLGSPRLEPSPGCTFSRLPDVCPCWFTFAPRQQSPALGSHPWCLPVSPFPGSWGTSSVYSGTKPCPVAPSESGLCTHSHSR